MRLTPLPPASAQISLDKKNQSGDYWHIEVEGLHAGCGLAIGVLTADCCPILIGHKQKNQSVKTLVQYNDLRI